MNNTIECKCVKCEHATIEHLDGSSIILYCPILGHRFIFKDVSVVDIRCGHEFI